MLTVQRFTWMECTVMGGSQILIQLFRFERELLVELVRLEDIVVLVVAILLRGGHCQWWCGK